MEKTLMNAHFLVNWGSSSLSSSSDLRLSCHALLTQLSLRWEDSRPFGALQVKPDTLEANKWSVRIMGSWCPMLPCEILQQEICHILYQLWASEGCKVWPLIEHLCSNQILWWPRYGSWQHGKNLGGKSCNLLTRWSWNKVFLATALIAWCKNSCEPSKLSCKFYF